jgi:hypothetical protein
MTQSLGLLHQVLHSPMPHARMGASIHQALGQNQFQNAGHADEDAHADHHDHDHAQGHANSANWLSALFDQHDGASDCRLHDGLSAFDVHLLVNVSVMPSLLASFYIAFSRITATARAAALYDARGPPATL